ncbi:MAG: hypothetical protein K6U87_06970 [Firmicutes bacterium]|nr:hypothetical protein [Bacillota bacterium]
MERPRIVEVCWRPVDPGHPAMRRLWSVAAVGVYVAALGAWLGPTAGWLLAGAPGAPPPWPPTWALAPLAAAVAWAVIGWLDLGGLSARPAWARGWLAAGLALLVALWRLGPPPAIPWGWWLAVQAAVAAMQVASGDGISLGAWGRGWGWAAVCAWAMASTARLWP